MQKKEPEYIWHSNSLNSKALEQALDSENQEAKNISLPIAAIILVILSLGVAAKRKTLNGRLRGTLSGIFIALALTSYLSGIGSVQIKIDPNNSLGPLSAEEGLEVFQALHKNIYKAFDYTSDRDIYKTLAQSVDGPLLEEIYTSIYNSLILHEEGGAVCRIRSVEILNLKWEGLTQKEGAVNNYTILATWRVHGIVKHWGHTHEKSQQYKARFTIAPRKGVWKIIEIEIIEQVKVDPRSPIDAKREEGQP